MAEESRTIYLMGTVIKLWVAHEDKVELLPEVEKRLIDYEKRFSANDETSELMELKTQAGRVPVKLDEDLFELIKLGKEHSLAKDSFLNIAMGPLIQAWHIGFSDAKRPSDYTIQALLKKTDPKNVYLNEADKTVFLAKEGMSLDLGAIAKGYFADEILSYLKEKRATAALIDLGGNVLTYGLSPKQSDGLWHIGIQDPFEKRGKLVAVLKVHDKSVVTSGIYERTNRFNDKVYHHIFDQKTGFPVETELASITVVSDKSVEGEIWTTRLFGKKPTEVIAALNAVEGLSGIVITRKGEMLYSKSLEKQLVL